MENFDILTILQLLGGIGLFLFGMSLMGTYLKEIAGSGLSSILERMTTSGRKGVGAIKGWGLGAGVTAIIQSSAATTIMLIGFVNAGIMKLAQAIPVVLGSNVGSTVTAQILRLGDLSSDSIALRLLKPSAFAPMLVGIGAFIFLFTKKKKVKQTAGILIGLGILFYGMTTMEKVFEPLRESAAFRSFFTSFENPLLGILTGLLITAVIQSSSASVGILQALSATGSVTYATAIPIIIGQNSGKCMTILLGSIGANKKAKRVALSYLIFNIFGAVLFSVVIYSVYYTAGIPWFTKTVNRGIIANLHLAFNLITSIILLPLSGTLASVTGKIVGADKVDPAEKEFAKLDDRLLNTPAVALSQCEHLMLEMNRRIVENYKLSTGLIRNFDPAVFADLETNEAFIDRCESVLSAYIVRIDRKLLPKNMQHGVSEILNSISDFERIGDYCMNIAYVSKTMSEAETVFTPAGQQEIDIIVSAAGNALETMTDAFVSKDRAKAFRVEPLADTIDRLKDIIKSYHIERLQAGKCSVQGGVDLYDLLNCFERIASHAANVAMHTIKRVMQDENFDEMHGHVKDVDAKEYKNLVHKFDAQYILPVVVYAKEEEAAEKAAAEKAAAAEAGV